MFLSSIKFLGYIVFFLLRRQNYITRVRRLIEQKFLKNVVVKCQSDFSEQYHPIDSAIQKYLQEKLSRKLKTFDKCEHQKQYQESKKFSSSILTSK